MGNISFSGLGSSFDPANPGPIGGTTPAVGTFLALALAGQSLTGTQATAALDISAVWNTSGDVKGLIYGRANITASGANSNLLDLGTVAAGSLFGVRKDGVINVNGATDGTFARRTDVNMLMLHGVGNGSVGVIGIGPGSGYNPGVNISQNCHLAWTNDVPAATRDITLMRGAAGVLALTANGSTVGAALEFREQTAPAAPGSNNVRIYAEDNGSGKTRLMAVFASGAAQQISIEP